MENNYTVLITGANRGLGLEAVKQYSEAGWQVIATCRAPDSAIELNQLAKASQSVSVYQLDMNDLKSMTLLAQQLDQQAVDLLWCNAGVYGPKGVGLGEITADVWMDTLKVNTVAPLLLVQQFLPHIRRSQQKTIALMTSKMGSMGDNTSGGSYIYRSSKAGLNAVGKSLAEDLHSESIKVVLLHPGWVKTDMGGPSGLIDVTTSIKGLRQVVELLTLENSGSFYAYDGQEIPW
ncbi:SDR family oxidoreductase [Endozoicomonas sp. SM1973]|uniref:SDR family oxidoreductase n=1 Tax=Spartinivicinus marinus TaxID=2994442 RepID=A0A853ID68_9GAMM|nr:SDR family oxidoreductase [Spartinivicinus marinus]MCX4028609.1 SDR family oxidoreductase [Spartinivicinus marinus]NYZ67125.1 SDR family oxidoreductase [Spartinivicinus marinus]